jgi:hypothetical protein
MRYTRVCRRAAYGRGVDDPAPVPRPASDGVERTIYRLGVASRAAGLLVGAGVAIIGIAPPADPTSVVAAAVVLLLWAAIATYLALKPGPAPLWTLTLFDLALVSVLCLERAHLVPQAVLDASAGTGWVDIVAATAVCVAQWGLRQPWGVVAGVAVAVVDVIGSGGYEAPVVFAETALVVAVTSAVLRREADRADRSSAEEARARRTAAVGTATRADERDQQRRLHDTVLATLTMVHTGSIPTGSQILRQRAADDLLVVDRLRSGGPGRTGSVRLDEVLREAASYQLPLAVTLDVPELRVPAPAGSAIGGSVGEALANVARHARTDKACVCASSRDGVVHVVVEDRGAGFEPSGVPGHRRGIRESIHGRMKAAGGGSSIRSAPGSGTLVEMWWPDE